MIKDLIRQIIKGELKVQSMVAVVNSVDENNFTCKVTPVNGDAELHDVRLKSIIDGQEGGIVIIPEEGSHVIVTLIENNDNAAYVSGYSTVKKILINAEVIFNGGNAGGLINIQELITQSTKNSTMLDAIKNAFTTWVPVPGDGGAALKAVILPVLQALTPGDFSNMEDTKVKH